jgi:hypothetical protein
MAVHFTYGEQQALSSLEVLVSTPAGSPAFQGTLSWIKTNSQPADLKSAMAKLRSADALVPTDGNAEEISTALEQEMSDKRAFIMQKAVAQANAIKKNYPDSADRARDVDVSPADMKAAKQSLAEDNEKQAKLAAAVAAKAAAALQEKAAASKKAQEKLSAARKLAETTSDDAKPEEEAPAEKPAKSKGKKKKRTK